MKTVKKATIAIIVVSSVLGAGIAGFVLGASIWANKPRGVLPSLQSNHEKRPSRVLWTHSLRGGFFYADTNVYYMQLRI